MWIFPIEMASGLKLDQIPSLSPDFYKKNSSVLETFV